MNLTNRLRDRLVRISTERDPYLASGGHFFVKEYIRQQLAQWGEVTSHNFYFRGQQHQNLILNLPGTEERHLSPILIGAHYDGVPGTPGADDNATGVAVLLELAAYFTAKPLKYPLQIVAFDLEEPSYDDFVNSDPTIGKHHLDHCYIINIRDKKKKKIPMTPTST